jgi:hypothetical protein
MVMIQKPKKAIGELMIQINVRLFTNNISPEKGQVLPKHACTNGAIRLEKNTLHDINPKQPVIFNSLMGMPSVIEKVLIAHGIILHTDNRMRKYIRNLV